MSVRAVTVLLAFTLLPSARADEDAEGKLKAYLKGIPGSEAGRVTRLGADGVSETFPDHVLFSHVIPLYPVAREAPAPLKHANVIAVPKKDGKPTLVTDTKGLEEFFRAHARAVKAAGDGDAAVTAWLRAAAELNQDGYFRFAVKAGVGKAEGDTVVVSGGASVAATNGDKGDVKASLTFKQGRLTTAETTVTLSAGMRPRCQATKLLDPDPIVRLMAEDSLRVMGASAKPYLDEQYEKASPELRKAIDRVRAKAAAEGR